MYLATCYLAACYLASCYLATSYLLACYLLTCCLLALSSSLLPSNLLPCNLLPSNLLPSSLLPSNLLLSKLLPCNLLSGNLLPCNLLPSNQLPCNLLDMLEVGVTAPQPPGALHHCASKQDPCTMNTTEWQTHFSAWAINSSPLILGLDLTDTRTLDAAWPIISNPEVIAINQAWKGDAGRLVDGNGAGQNTTEAPNCGKGSPCTIPTYLVYAKRIPIPLANAHWGRSASAVLLMNNDMTTATVIANLSRVPGLGPCASSGAALGYISHLQRNYMWETVRAAGCERKSPPSGSRERVYKERRWSELRLIELCVQCCSTHMSI